MVGGFVEQGYASLLPGCGACSADCWMSRLVVVGPPWRVSLDNPSCRTFNKEPASNGNSSTIAIAREECQTPNPAHVTAMFQRYDFGKEGRSANLPSYGLFVDPVALRLRFLDGKDRWMRVLRRAKAK